jgi:hypothetical protein
MKSKGLRGCRLSIRGVDHDKAADHKEQVDAAPPEIKHIDVVDERRKIIFRMHKHH